METSNRCIYESGVHMGTEHIALQIFTYTTEGIILIAAILSAIQAITKYNPLNKVRDWLNKPVKDDIIKIHTRLGKVESGQLKLMICTDALPLSERVVAGDIYVNERHLNGEVKIKYKILKELYETELKNKGGKS